LRDKRRIAVPRHFGLWRTAPLLVSLIAAITISVAAEAQPATAFASVENKSTSTGGNLWAPFGLHTDDLNAMVKRRNIRALVMINPIGFFYDNGQPMGIMYDALSALETYVNQKFKTGALKIQVSFISVGPDQAETALMQGVGDFVAYALVVTPQRQQQAAFTVPLETNAQQLLVTGPNFGKVTSLDDLSGKEIYANPLSVPYQVLQEVNDKLRNAGKPLIVIKPLTNTSRKMT